MEYVHCRAAPAVSYEKCRWRRSKLSLVVGWLFSLLVGKRSDDARPPSGGQRFPPPARTKRFPPPGAVAALRTRKHCGHAQAVSRIYLCRQAFGSSRIARWSRRAGFALLAQLALHLESVAAFVAQLGNVDNSSALVAQRAHAEHMRPSQPLDVSWLRRRGTPFNKVCCVTRLTTYYMPP